VSAELGEQINRVAWTLFQQRGYHAVTMDELASQLGISKKTLYTVITSKEALLKRLVMARLAEAESHTAAIIRREDRSAYDRLSDLIRYALLQFQQVQPLLLHDIHRHMPGLWAEIEATRDRLIQERFGAVLRQGMERGELRTDLDPSQVNIILFHSLRGVVTGTWQTTDPLDFAALLETTLSLLYEGIKNDE